MDEFMDFLTSRGFKGCPVCGSDHGFTWGNSAQIPGHESAIIDAYIPGTTTIPWAEGKVDRFNTPVIMLFCDNCSYIMNFSKIYYAFLSAESKKEVNG